MKVPRPVRSRASSTRLIGWPIQLVTGAEFPGKVRTISPPAPQVVKPRSLQTVANRLWRGAQIAQKGPDARRRPTAAREAYSLYVERAAEGANEADGPFSAICYPNPITGSQDRAVTRYFGAFSF